MKMKNPLKKIKIKDLKFQNVPASTAYTFILFGIIHFMVLGMNLADLQHIKDFNWGIFVGLGLDGTLQIQMTWILMFFDAFLAFYGVYLLKHLEPTQEEQDKEFRKKQDIDKNLK